MRLPRLLVLSLATALVVALCQLVVAPAAPASAAACFLDVHGTVSYPPSAETAPPQSLISARAYDAMTSRQAAALRAFEAEAVQGVLDVYDLPASDASDVLWWSRDEASGLLERLVLNAVNTKPEYRTPEQQQVADWIGGLANAESMRGRLQEGAEYASWAGLDVHRYWQLVDSGATKAALTDFLSQTPQPYSGTNPSTSTGGYCKYTPPAPYSDEYTGRTAQTCHVACTEVFLRDCLPKVTQEQFVRYGEARALAADTGRHDVVARSVSIDLAAARLGFLAAEPLVYQPYLAAQRLQLIGQLFDTFAPMPPDSLPRKRLWVETTKFSTLKQKAVDNLWMGVEEGSDVARPYARSLMGQFQDLLLNPDALFDTIARQVSWLRNAGNLKGLFPPSLTQLGSMIWEARTQMVTRLKSLLAELAKGLVKSAAGNMAEAVIFSLTAAVDTAISLAQDEELPGKIASNVTFARDWHVDPIFWTSLSRTGLSGPDGEGLIRLVFAAALTDPQAAAEACGDSCPPVPVRAASDTDPRFLDRPLSSTSWTQPVRLRIGKVYDDRWTTTSVRVSGRWFVENWEGPYAGMGTQSTALHYTNWDLQPETAWLGRDEGGHWTFFVVSGQKKAGFDPATCRQDATCWDTKELKYLDPDGNPRVARLDDSGPPVGMPTATPSAPGRGQAVAFTAGGFHPVGAKAPLTYQWRFQQEGCGLQCLAVTDGVTGPAYLDPETGAEVSHTWHESGIYAVQLTVTDAEGRKAVSTMNVDVG